MANQFLRVAALASVAAALAPASRGQSVPIPLSVSTEMAAQTVPMGVTAPVAGNHGFYTTYVSNGEPEANVRWISEDGQRSLVYDLAGVSRSGEHQGCSLATADYTPIPGGGLAVLGVWHAADGTYLGDSIITFDRQGSPAKVIDLSDPMSPTHIASFGDGAFLVLGGAHSGTGLASSEMYVIDSHGAVLAHHVFKTLDAPESPPAPADDQEPSKDGSTQQQTGDAHYPNTQAWQLFDQVSRTTLVSGDDGNVYVIPPDQTKKLFLVNAAGGVSQLALDAVTALQNEHITVLSAVEREGQMAVYYGVEAARTPVVGNIDLRKKLLCVYDVRIGALEATYQASDPRISAFLAGFDAGKFYFLSFPPDPVTHIRKAAIVVATP
jgi:hypothetical protein